MHTDKITRDRPSHLLNRWKDATNEVKRQINIQKTSNGWTSDNERFLQRISEEIQAKIWICEKSMGFYNNASKIVNWLIFIFSTVCTVITSIWAVNNSPDECGQTTGWAAIFVIVANGLIAVMSTGIELSGWNKKAQDYAEPLQDWRRLNWLVGYKITTKRKNRGNADDLIKELLDSVFAIDSTTPESPSFIKSQYSKRFSNYGLFKDESGKFEMAKEESPAKKPSDASSSSSSDRQQQQDEKDKESEPLRAATVFQQMFPKHDEPSSSDDEIYDHQTSDLGLAYQLQRLGDLQTIIQHHTSDEEEDDEDDVVIDVSSTCGACENASCHGTCDEK